MDYRRIQSRGWRKLFLLIIFLFSLFFLCGCGKNLQPVVFPLKEPYLAYFSPKNSLYPHLVYLIREARESVYAAFYKIELKEVSRALIEAHERGVEVRVFTDDLTSYDKGSQFSELNEFHLIKKDKDPESLMHHKFCLIDEEIVWTGSFNPTSKGSFKENNNVVIIKSRALAAEFMKEFEKLWEGKPSSSTNFSHSQISLNGAQAEAYFSLHDNPEEAIVRELEKAKESIHFALFTFTSPEIAHALIHKFAENVEVKGIMEKEQDSSFSRYRSLKKLRMPVEQDGNFYFMHHKFFIIDKKIVITGSFNPTWRANYQNRENLLIIQSSSLAAQYEEEFTRLWKEAVKF